MAIVIDERDTLWIDRLTGFLKVNLRIRFGLLIAVYIVNREDIGDLDPIRAEVARCCNEIVEKETVIFIAKNGVLATLGLYFTERRLAISWNLTANNRNWQRNLHYLNLIISATPMVRPASDFDIWKAQHRLEVWIKIRILLGAR